MIFSSVPFSLFRLYALVCAVRQVDGVVQAGARFFTV